MTRPALAATRTPAASEPAIPLVLGPALGTSAESVWGPAAENLGQRFDLLAWDLPGHGRSEPATAPFTLADLADAVAAAADEAGIDRFAYAGVSIGGAVGLELALRHPDRLIALTVICTLGQFGSPEGWRDRARRVRQSGMAPLAEGAAERMFAPSFSTQQPERADAVLRALADADADSYALCCEALAGYDVRDQLGTITVPTLVVAAEFDRVSSLDEAEALARTVQHGRAALLENAAHFAPPEQPERIAALIAEMVLQHA